MTMTRSRRASPGQTVHRKDAPRFTPSLEDVVGADVIERHLRDEERDLADNRQFLAAVAYGRVASLEFSAYALLEHAFERIDKLERELKAAKGLQRKSLDTRFSLDDLSVDQIDDRNVRIALARGEDEAAFTLKFPVVIDRGVWSERAHYERGDGVTHKGSFWIAQDEAQGKPGEGGTWRMAVKAGRDGKDAGR